MELVKFMINVVSILIAYCVLSLFVVRCAAVTLLPYDLGITISFFINISSEANYIS